MAAIYNINDIEDKHCKRFDPFARSIDALLRPESGFLSKDYASWLGKDGRLELVQTAYATKIKNSFGEEVLRYWDYPYKSELVDHFNRDLAGNEKVVGIDVLIHNQFHHLQEYGVKAGGGFIDYSYSIDKDNKSYLCYDKNHNLNSVEERLKEEDILSFLPIIDCAVFMKNSADRLYLNSVDDLTRLPGKGDTRLLILTKKMGMSDVPSERKRWQSSFMNSSILCAFKVLSQESNEVPEGVIAELYDKIIYLVDTYFDSPVLEAEVTKEIREEVNQHILSYHHTIGNLDLGSYPDSFKRALEDNRSDLLLNNLNEFKRKINKIDLIYYLIFEKEFLRQGDTNVPSPLKGKLSDVFKKYIEEYVLLQYYIPFSIEVLSEKDNINIDSISSPPFRGLHDFILLFSNLLDNACRETKNNRSVLRISILENRIINVVNEGVIPQPYIDYLNGLKDEYPEKKENTRRKRGLEVVKELCNLNDSLFIIECKILKKKSTLFTVKIR